MKELLSYLEEFNFASVVLRLFLAMVCGGLLGLERKRKHRPADARTYMMVCMGAALTMLIGEYEYNMVNSAWADLMAKIGVNADVSRIGAQVVNGIGFLGAGTILINGRKQSVKGLTTAAGLWASGCMGLAIGVGFYECVIIGGLLIYAALSWWQVPESLGSMPRAWLIVGGMLASLARATWLASLDLDARQAAEVRAEVSDG